MTITGVNNYYNSYLEYSASTKSANAKEQSMNKEKQVRNDTIESIQNQDVSNYYNYLKKNCSSLKNGNVAIDGEYLKKCSADSYKAKELEEFLQKIPELEEQGYKELAARNKALGGTVTYYQQSWVINKDGSVQSTVYSVTETDMTNAERMKKSMDERLEKQKEKKAEEKNKEEKAEEKRVDEERLEEKKTEEQDAEGIEVLKDNRHWKSMRVDYVTASSLDKLE